MTRFGLTLMLLPSLAFAAPTLLVPGSFHADEVRARSGEAVLSLEITAQQVRLVNRTLRIVPAHDPFADSDDEKTGKVVVVDGQKEAPLAIFSGLPLHSGVVRRVSVEQTALKPGVRVELNFGGSAWTLTARARREVVREEEFFRNYELVLSDGRSEQVLASFKSVDDALPTLLFAGDLDADGKLDLLIDTTWHYNVSRPAVFLSSQAKPGAFVFEAASMTTHGC